jgi:short-subunit dehydrogenase
MTRDTSDGMTSKGGKSDGKVVVVTGASMGIGEAIAKVFADHGARVVLLSRDANRSEAARQRIGHTDDTLAGACDVRNREEIDRALSLSLNHFGRVDVWVNNAGVGIRDSVAEMEMSACRDLFETNFFGAVACLQAVVPAMRKTGGGTIINVSSVAGHLPVPFLVPYSATKFALNAIGKGARVELKRDHINVLTVCPGYVNTDFGSHVVVDKRGRVRPQSIKGISAERVARATFSGFLKKKREVIVPWTMIPVVKLYQLFPGVVEWGMSKAVK